MDLGNQTLWTEVDITDHDNLTSLPLVAKHAHQCTTLDNQNDRGQPEPHWTTRTTQRTKKTTVKKHANLSHSKYNTSFYDKDSYT